ncbi:MAG: hypothetical protein Q4D58_09895 [Synergistaceae bacterium]|nr:hypothetical protein [Synergistaceae bacterium]
MNCRVVFFDKDGEPIPMEFDGEAARFFNEVQDCFCNPQNKDLKAVVFNAAFERDGERDRLNGGMLGDREALVRLIVNLIVEYAVTVSGRPAGISVADISDYALRVVRGAEREKARSSGGIILPRGA